MNVAGYRSKIVAIITGSTLVAAIFLLGNTSTEGAVPGVDVQPQYNISAVTRLCNALPGHAITALIGNAACAESLALGGPRTTTTTFTIPEGQMNFSSFNTYEPSNPSDPTKAPKFTPGCNQTAPNNRTYSAADGRSPTNADGIDNDFDGLIDGADSDGECLAPGDLVGGMRSDTDLALFNGTCSSDVTVDFAFYNVALPNNPDDPRASTNIATPGFGGPLNEGQKDRIRPMMTDTLPVVPGPDGLADANSTGITKYPDWFLDLFDPDWRPWLVSEGGPQEGAGADPTAPHNGPLKPVIPIALYGAITDVAGTATPLYFAQFDDGILGAAFTDPNHYFNVAQAGMGQLNMSVLTDVTKARQESSTISDFCSELIARTMFFGTTLTNGMKRAINPSAAGTAITKYWTTSQRDTDNDSYENQIDTCPTVANLDDIRILGVGDPDLNRIDTACDPGGFVGNINVDNDKDASLFGFQNAQDNCPLIPNGSQEEQEDQTTTSAADGGPKLDGIGNECDSEAGTLNVAQNSSLINITSSSVANPSVITTATNHGLSTGNTVVISNHTGSTPNINGTHTITKITNTTFSIPVNVTAGGTQGKVTAAFVSIAMSDTVASGHYHLKAPVQPRCYGGVDADGDGYCTDADGFDANATRHNAWSGSLTNLTAADRDGDGYSDYVESYLGTDPVKRCSYTTLVGDENSSKGTNSIGSTNPLAVDGWPSDLNDSGSANNQDVIYGFVTSLAPIGLKQNAAGALKRLDLNADGFVNNQDVIFGFVTKLAPTGLNKTCTLETQQ